MAVKKTVEEVKPIEGIPFLLEQRVMAVASDLGVMDAKSGSKAMLDAWDAYEDHVVDVVKKYDERHHKDYSPHALDIAETVIEKIQRIAEEQQ